MRKEFMKDDEAIDMKEKVASVFCWEWAILSFYLF